ncbi:stalk domain-containing protein [Paenibacillus cremeus]|uniref:S-layer protein n=1 Tax=Paenibacillus cremeus TaxID=2163881 RepID=A0A559KDR1_9BACL|nr:stalk domain-containing protein [Paenibacillus cremeus]TVY10272.1 S-layer protein [Paenibacillus cremeus]
MYPIHRLTKVAKLLSIAILLWTTLLVVPGKPVHAESYSYGTSPTNTIGVARPTISFLFKTDIASPPSSYAMYLNDAKVAVSYDTAKGVFSYTPTQDLPAGTYTARMTITLSGYQPIEKSWTFTVAQSAVKQLPAPSADQTDGLAAINDYRLFYGLPPVKLSDTLNAAADAHARYLDANRVGQNKASTESLHDETAGKSGYIGKNPLERVTYFGYAKGIGEDASLSNGTLRDSIDSLFDAPYHRSPFLDPTLVEVGVGRTGNYTVLEFGLENVTTSQSVVSPAPGERYVPTTFDGHETPDPLRNFSNVTYPVGYPIMAEYYGSGVTKVTLMSAELRDSSGQTVDLLIDTPNTDEHLQNAVILIPRKPLQPDTSYHVKVQWQATQRDGSAKTETKEWDFTTEPIAQMGKQLLHQSAADYKRFYVSPAPVARVASFGLDASSYKVDGLSYPMKRTPLIVDGFSYLYIRDLAAALGATVEWDDVQRAAIYTKGTMKVTLYTTTNQYEVNGVLKSTDTPARLIDSNTMVPVRLLAEVLGAKVTYIDSTRTVVINY